MNTTEKHYTDCWCPQCAHKRLIAERNDLIRFGLLAVAVVAIIIFLS